MGIFAKKKKKKRHLSEKVEKEKNKKSKAKSSSHAKTDSFQVWKFRLQWVEMRSVLVLQNLCHVGSFFLHILGKDDLVECSYTLTRNKIVQGTLGTSLMSPTNFERIILQLESQLLFFIFMIMKMKKQASMWFQPLIGSWMVVDCWKLNSILFTWYYCCY